MGLDLEHIEGQTPIDEDEKEGLLIETISTKRELDEFEQLNIEEALQWVIGKKFKSKQVFTEKFICNVHYRMFGNVWAWAGNQKEGKLDLKIAMAFIGVGILVIFFMPMLLTTESLSPWADFSTTGQIGDTNQDYIVSINNFEIPKYGISQIGPSEKI